MSSHCQIVNGGVEEKKQILSTIAFQNQEAETLESAQHYDVFSIMDNSL